MFKIDMKKFKKVASDNKSTTLQHEKGHKIIIAHKALDPKVRQQLDQLPHFDNGGAVDSSPPEASAKNAADMQSGATKSGVDPKAWVNNIKEGLGLAKGGTVKQSNPKLDESKKMPPKASLLSKKMADGGGVSDDQNQVDTDQQPDTSQSPKQILDTADQEAIQPYGPVDATVEAAKWIGRKVLDNMTQDTELYHSDPQAWAAKHAMNMAMGTIGAAGPKAPFHELAAMQKAEQMAALQNRPVSAAAANAMEEGVQPAAQVQAKIAARLKNKNGNPNKMADGGDVPNASSQPAPDTIEDIQAAAQPQAPQEQAQQEAAPEETPTQQPNAQGSDSINPYAGYQQQLQGIDQQAAAEGALGAQKAQVLDQQVGQNLNLQKNFLTSYNELNQERLKHVADIQAGHIDPDKYWENHSKLAAGLGILIGGLAGGKTGVNPAMEVINNGIDRSIHAQAQNLQSDQNLLAANLQQFGNMRDAYSMTKLMMSDALSNKLDSAAAKSADPMAQARAAQLKGQLQLQVAPEMIQLGMRRALINAGNAQGQGGQQDPAAMLPYLRQLAPDTAKEWEGRIIPGANGQPSQMAQIPVPQAVRDQIVAKQQLGAMARDFYDWSSNHSGSVDPATVNEGKTKAAELQSMYRNSINGGVFKKGEQEFIGNIIDEDPTKFFNKLRVLPQLKEVINSNDKQLNTLKQGYGIAPQNPAANLPPQQQAFVKWAQANPNDPRAEVVLRKLGLH